MKSQKKAEHNAYLVTHIKVHCLNKMRLTAPFSLLTGCFGFAVALV
jgi:hypothetical protein